MEDKVLYLLVEVEGVSEEEAKEAIEGLGKKVIAGSFFVAQAKEMSMEELEYTSPVLYCP